MESKYLCHICNKYYKNNSSYWNHKKRFHSDESHTKPHNCVGSPTQNHTKPHKSDVYTEIHKNTNLDKDNQCDYCNKIFSRKDSLYRHINKNYCSMKKKIDKEKDLEEENTKLKQILKEDQENIKKIQEDFEQIKKEMSNLNSEINNNNSTNHNNTNNNNATMNNNQQTNNVLIQLGKENIIDVMPKSDQIKILNTCYNSLYRLIKEIHCSDKYPQFKNLAITNLSDNYGHRYDDKLDCFVKCHKNELIETLIDNRIVDIEDILNANIDEISEEKAKKLIILIEEITEKRGCYKNKKEQIKLLIYNECKIKL